MKIAIISAGLSSVFCANILKREEFKAEVFERTPKLSNISGGIEIWGNDTRCLKKTGFEKALATIDSTPNYKVIRCHEGHLLQKEGLQEF